MNNKNTTREEMLKECIGYAVKNGWNVWEIKEIEWVGLTEVGYRFWIKTKNDRQFNLSLSDLLFDHLFCKAVYGDKDEDGDLVAIGCGSEMYHWQYRLIQQSIADDPLLYIYNYIKNERR